LPILVLALVVSTSTAFAKTDAIARKNSENANSQQAATNSENEGFFENENPVALNVKESTEKENNAAASNQEENFANEEGENFGEEGAENSNATNNASGGNEDKVVNEDEDGDLVAARPKTPFDQIVHPTAPSYWRTRELLINSGITDFAPLQACRNSVGVLADKALNQAALLAAINFLHETMKTSTGLYHWCFYYSMMQLDLKLDSDLINRSYVEKFNYFIKEMKVLWVMARALDRTFATKKYFGYLRPRYVSISKEHFGKHLDVMNAPLGDKSLGLPALEPKGANSNFNDN
jgi:hypothetical protein